MNIFLGSVRLRCVWWPSTTTCIPRGRCLNQTKVRIFNKVYALGLRLLDGVTSVLTRSRRCNIEARERSRWGRKHLLGCANTPGCGRIRGQLYCRRDTSPRRRRCRRRGRPSRVDIFQVVRGMRGGGGPRYCTIWLCISSTSIVSSTSHLLSGPRYVNVDDISILHNVTHYCTVRYTCRLTPAARIQCGERNVSKVSKIR